MIATRAELEQRIIALFEEILGVDGVRAEDSFGELGGTSLQAFRLVTRLERLTGVVVSVTEVFEELTVADLVDRAGKERVSLGGPMAGGDGALSAVPELASPTQGAGPIPNRRKRGKLTPDQRRLFLFQQLSSASCVYNMAYVAEWSGPLDRTLLRDAAQSLVLRYDALRTTFTMRGSDPVAEIQDDVEVTFDWFDYASAGQEAAGAAERRLAAEVRTPFVLDQPSLFRIVVIEKAPGEHLVCLRMHHIVGDAASVALLWNALLREYSDRLAGRSEALPLPAPSLSLLDAADWFERRLAGDRLESLKRYWTQELAGDLPIMALPYDRDADPLGTQQGVRVPIALSASLTQRLRELGGGRGATLYVTLLASFAAFLHRYTQQSDILIGSPVTTRIHQELQELVGVFINMVVIRTAVRGQRGFEALLDDVRRTVLAALEHREMPFDSLVELLHPPRDLGISPLFQVMFSYQETMPPPTFAGDAKVGRLRRVHSGTAKYALTLELCDEGGQLSGMFEYDCSRFDHDTIERMKANFERFLTALVENADTPIERLPLLSDSELRRLEGWNRTGRPFSSQSTIHALIERQAERTPAATAVVFEEESITYGELEARANQLARLLIHHGVGPETPVGIRLHRSARLIIAFLAVLKAGGYSVPIDPEYPEARCQFILEDAGIALLLSDEPLRGVDRESPVTTWVVDGDLRLAAELACTRPSCRASAESSAYMIYTSGSTGKPKGVRVCHRSVCNLAEAESEVLGVCSESRVLQFASFSFDVSISEIVTTLCGGGTLVMASPASLMPGPELLATLTRHRITHLTLPPSALAVLPSAPLPDLRVLAVAGEACGLDLVKKWAQGRRFLNSYGPTEATVYATNAELGADTARVTIGRPLHNCQIWIVDPRLQRLPVGVAGELCIAGVNVASGYRQRDELTAERFVPIPWAHGGAEKLYRTGDLARQLADGNIEYLGRMDRQVKVRGFRVELGEIESVLRGHASVVDAVAMVRPDYLESTGILAYVSLDADATEHDPNVILSRLRQHAKARLPEYMLPSVYVPMREFPRLPNGKLDRNRFPLPDGRLESDPDADEAPIGPVEEAIVSVWSRLLGQTRIGRHRSFFELGGHSLLAAKTVALLAEEFEIALSVRAIFEHRTAASLARVAAKTIRASMPILRTGTQQSPLSASQQGMWFLEQLDPGTAAYNVSVIKEMPTDVDPDLLKSSLDTLLARHAAFRIRLVMKDGEVVQTLADEPVRYHAERLGRVSDEAWEQALLSRAEPAASAPFELLDAPLWRINLVTAEPGRCAILLTAHHIVVDQHALALFDRDLLAIYEARKRGGAAPSPQLTVTPLDFAMAEREQRAAGRWREQVAHWKSLFSSMPPSLDLPVDDPSAARRESPSVGAVAPFVLDLETTDAVRTLARSHGTTPVALLLAALQVFLYRYTGTRDLVVGMPFSQRRNAALDETIGMFLNTIAVRGRVEPERRFSDFLGEASRSLSEAIENSDVPYDDVLGAVDPGRTTATSGLFRVMLACSSTRSVPAGTDGLRIATRSIHNGAAKFDLTFFIEEHEESLVGKIEYRRGLFQADTMKRWAAHFCNLVRSIVETPDAPLSALEIFSPRERACILREWNATETTVPEGCAHEWFEIRVARVPDAIALEYRGQQLRYRTLNARANRLARYLRDKGVGPNVLVGVLLERSLDLVIAVLAVLKAGGAYVPIDPMYPERRIKLVLDDSRAHLTISCGSLADRISLGRERLVLVDGLESDLAAFDDSNLGISLSPDDVAYVIYTSGSTGTPKGVMIPHRGLSNYLAHALDHYGSAGGRGSPMHTSIAFDATVTSLYVPLLSGTTLFVMPQEDEIEHLGDVWSRESGLTLAKVTPAHLELLSQVLPPGAAGNAMQLVVGGEALHSSTVQFWREHAPDVRVINEYGPTEATVGCCVFDIEAGKCTMSGDVPIGRPIRNTRLYVLDESLQPVPIGVPGELYIGGDGLALGYLNRPDLTASRFLADPFCSSPDQRMYRTGDRVKALPDGNLVYLGRNDQQTKLRGFRVELGEIEAVLLTHPLVLEAVAAVRRTHPGQQLIAYVVLRESGADVRAIKEHVAAQLPAYMVPSRLVPIGKMPLTSNGKVDRDALGRYDAQPEPEDIARPRNEIETALSTIWKDVLRLEAVGIHDNFFERGGDSILSLQIVAKARQAGISVKPRMLFHYPTIAMLATVAEWSAPPGPDDETVEGRIELTPIQTWFFEHNHANPNHYNQSHWFRVAPQTNVQTLEAAFDAAFARHDALRARFAFDAGRWTQWTARTERTTIMHERLPDEAPDSYLDKRAAQYQGTLDIRQGPVARIVHFAGRDGAYLLVVIHHLVVDTVSFRILIDDVLAAYSALSSGTKPVFAQKTASYQRWARELQAYAASPKMAEERAFWKEYLAAPPRKLPRDVEGCPNPLGRASEAKLAVAMGAEATRKLLAATKAYYGTVGDILLAALIAALRSWIGDSRLQIDIERHGREGLDETIDVSRTVGWFTVIHPLVFEVGAEEDLGALVRAAKEARRNIPNHGIGFGLIEYGPGADVRSELRSASEICFNYLGRSELASPSGTGPLQRMGPFSLRNQHAVENERAYSIVVDADVQGDTLRMEWSYSREVHAESTIRALASAMEDRVARATDHCLAQPFARHTPSDFPRAMLSQAELDALDARCGHDCGDLEDVYPLSFTQEGILFHALNDEGAALYFEQLLYRLSGDLDAAVLRGAWEEVARRHAILRTRFDLRTGSMPLQVVRSCVQVDWREVDCRQASGQSADCLDALLAADRDEGFGLDATPPWRVTLVRRGEQDSILLLSHHHALLDGWSVALLLAEVERAYRRETETTASAALFRDVIEHQRQRQRQDEVRRYWCTRLQGIEEATRLPAASRPVGGAPAQIRKLDIEIPSSVAARLETWARCHGLTMSTAVRGAWAILLQRHTASHDCLFGVTVSGRAMALHDLERTVGLLISTLPCRVRFTPEASLVSWLQAIQNEHANDEQHADVCLPDLKQAMGLGGASPLFESILVFENYPVRTAPPDPLFVFERAEERTNYPLTIVLSPRNGLHGTASYDTRYYGEATLRGVLRHFVHILDEMVTKSDAPLDAIAMLSCDDRNALLEAWCAPPTPYFEGCVHELFERQAAATPNATALEFRGGHISYAELNERAEVLAGCLRRRGVAPGVLVGVFLRRGPELIAAILATLKAGGAYVPIDPAYPGDRVRYMLTDSAAKLLISDTGLVTQTHLPDIEILCLDLPLQEEAARKAGSKAKQPSASDLAYVMYTSGSTGLPKGVMIEHSSLVNYLTYGRRQYAVGPDTRSFFHSSIGFDATITSVFLPLISGGTVIVAPEEADVRELARGLASDRSSHLLKITPVHLELLAKFMPPSAASNVVSLVVGGEALTGAALEVWQRNAPRIRIFNEYGPTETVVGCCVFEMSAETRIDGNVPIGRPIDNTKLYVLDERMEPVPEGAEGELYIGGAGVARGYLNRPELNVERFVPDPFGPAGRRLYRTGDRVRGLPNGDLEFIGRRDRQVKLRGHRIELGEIEAQLGEHPAIRHAAVTLCSGGGEGYDAPFLSAYHVAKDGAAPTSADLREHLRGRLPEYMIPSFFTALSEIPQTPNGKIDYKALPIPEQPRSTAVAPTNDVERCLCSIWEEVLDRAAVGIEDNFFDLGGHSLKALRVVARVGQRLDVEMSLKDLFDQPCVRELSMVLASRMGSRSGPALPKIARISRTVRSE